MMKILRWLIHKLEEEPGARPDCPCNYCLEVMSQSNRIIQHTPGYQMDGTLMRTPSQIVADADDPPQALDA